MRYERVDCDFCKKIDLEDNDIEYCELYIGTSKRGIDLCNGCLGQFMNSLNSDKKIALIEIEDKKKTS